jgi:hypothetical protein
MEEAAGQEKSVERKPSTCRQWIRGFTEAQPKGTPPPSDHGGWLARLRPVCNERDEMVSEVSGRVIVLFGPPCQGGAMRDLTHEIHEIKVWQKDVSALRQRYEVVDESRCPNNIP